MLVEKTVIIDRETGRILDTSIQEVPGDPTPYTEALAEYYASVIEKNQEES